jgi:hypothetical protein
MAPHWTDWSGPVSPAGCPFSTISASTTTSEKATPMVGTKSNPRSKAVEPRASGSMYRTSRLAAVAPLANNR